MKTKGKRVWNRVVSFALAVVLMATAFAVTVPEEVQAAEKKFKSTGKTTLTIKDSERYYDDDLKPVGKVTWIKYTATKNGFLKVTAANSAKSDYTYALGQWRLYNKTKKKALSPTYTYNANYSSAFYTTDYFGVKKGTTYYLQLKPACGVKLTASFTAVTDKSGSKQGSALNLQRNKKTNGLITAGSKAAHWYKYTLSSAQPLKVYFSPYLTNDVEITIFGPGVQTMKKTVKMTSQTWAREISYTTKENVRAGTYYIAIRPVSTTCTGYYKVRWN